MTRTPAKSVPMCCVTIGHYDYLLPADKGMKLVELMQQAFECRDEYSDHGYIYHVGEQPRVEFKLVRPNQVRAPQPPSPPAPRLLK